MAGRGGAGAVRHHALPHPSETPIPHCQIPQGRRRPRGPKCPVTSLTKPFLIRSHKAQAAGEEPDHSAKQKEYLCHLPPGSVVLYTDGSNFDSGECRSAWIAFRQKGKSHIRLIAGNCSLGKKAEVYNAELHAIQEGLRALQDSGHQHQYQPPPSPNTLLICADNQSALSHCRQATQKTRSLPGKH